MYQRAWVKYAQFELEQLAEDYCREEVGEMMVYGYLEEMIRGKRKKDDTWEEFEEYLEGLETKNNPVTTAV